MSELPKEIEDALSNLIGTHGWLRDEEANPSGYATDEQRARDAFNEADTALRALLAPLVADAARYTTFRRALFFGDVGVGEAWIRMKVVGVCPSESDVDAAIDARIAARGTANG